MTMRIIETGSYRAVERESGSFSIYDIHLRTEICRYYPSVNHISFIEPAIYSIDELIELLQFLNQIIKQ